MTFKIIMRPKSLGYKPIEMPGDKGLSLREALWMADLYRRKNPTAEFEVVEDEAEEVFKPPPFFSHINQPLK